MAKVAIEDLSGASTPVTENPYDGLINAIDADAVRLDRSCSRLIPNLSFRASFRNDTNSTE